ncbi:MAG TPA: M28 family metallopeptidase [Vicinamibacteria bacterium]|nr:M28 family metallopeptidase [Vicinamibacteria bacterium]
MTPILLALFLAPAPAVEIRPEALRAHMGFLASDLLEGRRTGTRGYDLAAAYVAARFEAAGIAPGVSGSYYQPVPFREGIVDQAKSEMVVRRGGEERRLAVREDFLPAAGLSLERGEVDAEVVYVGFGVTAPERRYDDYAGLDVRGKIVLMASGAPATLPTDERAHHSSRRTKRENAVAHGAAGVLSFSLPEDEARFPWARKVPELSKGANGWRHPDGRIEAGGPEIRATALVSLAEAERLFGGREAFEAVVRDAEAGRPKSAALGVTARLRIFTRHRDYESPNVVGLLQGADPVRKGEAVVFSAHLDHEGVGEPVGGDAIWNGAFDNASGVATLLEIARSLATAPRPKRSILFLACVAEEEGLLGAEYFSLHPPLPPVANVNTDMFLALFPLAEVIALGAEHSSLGAIVREEAPKAGFELVADPFPRETLFVRSDQYPFVRRGVPAVAIAAGLRSRDPKIDGRAVVAEWRRTRYHTPRDDMGQAIDWDSLTRFAELNRRIGLRLATDPRRPRWIDGDFFGKLFGGGR